MIAQTMFGKLQLAARQPIPHGEQGAVKIAD
jgi:hypothetical protein